MEPKLGLQYVVKSLRTVVYVDNTQRVILKPENSLFREGVCCLCSI